jgi:ElaB/YqjD/DUF883 family membrane-anchored ribosome-binding protein
MSSNSTTRARKPGRSQRNARSVTDQVRRRAGAAKDDLRQIGNTVKDAAREKLDELSETAKDRYEEGRERALELGRTMQRFIEDQPMKCVLIAAGVGLILGKFWIRR